MGRTGRAGRSGTSISFLTREDWSSAGELINILEEANQEVPDELREMKKRFSVMQERRERERSNMGGGGRRYEIFISQKKTKSYLYDTNHFSFDSGGRSSGGGGGGFGGGGGGFGGGGRFGGGRKQAMSTWY